jgi:hypothetical protein
MTGDGDTAGDSTERPVGRNRQEIDMDDDVVAAAVTDARVIGVEAAVGAPEFVSHPST